MPENYVVCSLLYIFIILHVLSSIISAQSASSSSSSNINYNNIAEGGGVPEAVEKNFSKKLNTTFPTILNRTKELSSHSVPTNVNSSYVSKQLEKPFNAEETAKVETLSKYVIATLPSVTHQTTKKPDQVPKHIPTKPQITEHDDNPEKPEVKSNTYKQKISSIDALKKKNNRANYVIPIVAVILSIPLVAIIISVVYKRGADWWQHRNYRRMDFLIEGMYNT